MTVRLILVLSMSSLLLSGQQARRIYGDLGKTSRPIRPSDVNCPAEAAAKPPALAVSSDDFVKLDRTSCFGSCPVYTVVIHADGRVVWQQKIGAQPESPVSQSAQREDARALIERIRAAGFWGLCESYPGGEDAPRAITTVHIAGQEKQVSDGGLGAPDSLREIEYEIDLMADSHGHRHGDPRTEDIKNLYQDSWYAKPGLTKLMQASARGNLAEVKQQLSARADPNAQDASGWTALMYAAWAERPEVMQALLDVGADPDLRSQRGQTAIMAVSTAFTSLEEKVRILKNAGGDINAQDADGETALMIAAGGFDRSNVVSILLREGARKDLRDAKGHTVLERLELKARSRSREQAELEKLRRAGKTFALTEQMIFSQQADYEKLRKLLEE